MNYDSCDACRERGANNREKNHEKKISYPSCIICGFTGGNERLFLNYCNKHVIDGRKADIEHRNLKWCKGINRGCPNPELPKDYPYERCETCRHKETTQDQKRSETKLEETLNQIRHTQ
jgi:hypothetical protein